MGKISPQGDFTVDKGAWEKLSEVELTGYDEATKLLLHFDGVDGATESSGHKIVLDSGNTGHVVTSYANNVLGGYFGDAKMQFNGTTDYMTIPDHADWDISTNFTIDLWVKHNVATGSSYDTYIQQHKDSNNYWSFYRTTNESLRFEIYSEGGYIVVAETLDALLVDANWHHVALCKVGNEYGIYLDGTQVEYLDDNSMTTFTGDLFIGKHVGGNYFNGYMDEIRITHANSFSASPNAGKTDTITVPIVAHVSDSDTKLLLHCDTIDSSGKAQVIRWYGAELDTSEKEFGTASCKFNGTSDYLSIDDSSDWDLFGSSTDNQTVDFWVKHANDNSQGDYLMQYQDSSNFIIMRQWTNAQMVFRIVIGGTDHCDILTDTGTGITDTEWHHIAWCKVGNEFGLFLDGAQIGYATETYTNTISGALLIGKGTTLYHDGYIDELRIYKGNYFSASPNSGKTDTITVPTSPYSAALSTSSIEFQGLDGDSDEVYRMTGIINCGVNSTVFYIQPNSDSGANYYYQQIGGNGSTISSSRASGLSSGLQCAEADNSQITSFEFILYAKSGNNRTGLLQTIFQTAGTSVGQIKEFALMWSDTSSNITSLYFYGNQTDALLADTQVTLWRKI